MWCRYVQLAEVFQDLLFILSRDLPGKTGGFTVPESVCYRFRPFSRKASKRRMTSGLVQQIA